MSVKGTKRELVPELLSIIQESRSQNCHPATPSRIPKEELWWCLLFIHSANHLKGSCELRQQWWAKQGEDYSLRRSRNKLRKLILRYNCGQPRREKVAMWDTGEEEGSKCELPWWGGGRRGGRRGAQQFGHREEGKLGETKYEHVGRRGEAEENVGEIYF